MNENPIDVINNFLNGYDPMEHIVAIECDYNDEEVFLVYINDKGNKVVRKEPFKPFVWAKYTACDKMFDGDRKLLKSKMSQFGIGVKELNTKQNINDESHERLENGYRYMFYAKRKMSFQKFLQFFQLAKTPIYSRKKDKNEDKSQDFLAVRPTEQYMMSTGRRLFKGYENYDDLKRLLFDLETEGLNPNIHAIDQIGIRTNKGFEKIITIEGNTPEEKRTNELKAIIEFLTILRDEKPDVIAGHNSEVFDWNFIEVRCQVLGLPLSDISTQIVGFRHPIYKKKKETVLKLGGEIEFFKPTMMWGHNILDSLHAVRRAQAIDSNMKSANLKYVTKYLDLKKENRVYVHGQQIGTVWRDIEPNYAFNNTNGDWYKISENKGLEDGYELVTGKYIVERYLLDDIWETDKVELALNESNFLVGKLLPTPFQRSCTMGTAGIWKLIMLAWCYENNLAVPSVVPKKSFTGGLSRLLKVGYADNVVKLDYNSLYPSIDLTWNVKTKLDITNSMLMMLNYVLTQREKYKELKAVAGGKAKEIGKKIEKLIESGISPNSEEVAKLKSEKQKWDIEKSSNDKKQLPLKILANSFFGSYGSPNLFNFGDTVCAEKTTCIGRMSLRLMISHFTNIGYTPIVGDSVTGDTPLFVKNKISGFIDIKTINEIINENEIKVDELGREYDYSEKPYKVLCRSGWEDVKYVYRHKTDKPIYDIIDGDTFVSLTEDHSLFDCNQTEIKPSEINNNTILEYFDFNKVNEETLLLDFHRVEQMAKMCAKGLIDRVPMVVLNGNKRNAEHFLKVFYDNNRNENMSKLLQAGLLFLKNKI